MKNPVIKFQAVSKKYVKQRLRYGMLSDTISQFFTNPLSSRPKADPPLAELVTNHQSLVTSHNIITALDNVSFSVKKGEALGIIGPNGAGKSTILKLISKVTVPDSGGVSVQGKIGALIELGAGLHPELTGRENIFLYGAILGMKKQEVQAKYNEIVDFAEIHDFLDMPIKRYSSGMYARLGFAVAVNMDPDILLIDEVLAVGDESFQKKCFNKMNQIKKTDTTIVFVSHNLDWIKKLCSRAIWLKHGNIKKDGRPEQVIETYRQSL